MVIKVTKTGTVISGSAEVLEELRLQFNQQHWIRLPQIFELSLLQTVHHHLGIGEFYTRTHLDKITHGKKLTRELCMREDMTINKLLHLLINNARLFQFIENITGCRTIGCFRGRVYRIVPNSNHYMTWHTDLIENRMLGASINLSPEPYQGGLLQIRDCKKGQIVGEATNTGFGDCLIFQIAPHLEHRITELEGKIAKTAFSGWFKSKPNFISILKCNSTERSKKPYWVEESESGTSRFG